MKLPLILALDIGTSSVRSAIYDASGEVLPETMVKNERTLTATDDGGAEIDAEEAFDQVCSAIDDVHKKLEKIDGTVAYVATSSFWHSLLGVDKKGKPTTKVLGWADTRSRNEVDRLRKYFDEDTIHTETGARFHSSYWPAKLLWLKRSRPEAFKETAHWLSLSDYVWFRFFGSFTTSISMASGTGLYDIHKCAWHSELVKYVKPGKEALPPIAADKATALLSAKYAKRWPRFAEAKWFPAIGDGAANNIGAGCIGRSKAAIMIGTSGAMRIAYKGSPPKTIPSGLWCYRISHEYMIIGGALSDGGGLYRWLKDNLRLKDDDDLTEDEIAKRPPAGHGITFLPFVAGERSTGYHENAAGAIIGLHSSDDAVDIVQAALESVAYRFAEIFDQLKSIFTIKEIVASGGALRQSPVWTQIIADVLARDLSLPDTREASSRGAVLLVLETIGKIDKLENVKTPRGEVFKFNKKNQKAYKAGRKMHEEIYGLLIKK